MISKILLIDDDTAILRMLTRYLSQEGFEVKSAVNSTQAFQSLEQDRPDIILLDIMLPDEDGLTIARKIRRADSTIGIMMVTGKKDVIDRVVGLEMGADDYISKPFHLREILARIRSILRRKEVIAHNAPETAGQVSSEKTAYFGGWKVDLGTRELTAPGGKAISLTSGDFRLLEIFLKNSGRVLSRDQILDFVAGRQWTPFDRSVDTRVRRLRGKLEKDSASPEIIKTIRGEGYLFSAPVTFNV